jgi:hypothetical protein
MDQIPDDVPELIWVCPSYKPHSRLRKFLQSLLLACAIVVATIAIIIIVAEYGSTNDGNGGGSAPASGSMFQGAVTKG